MSTKKASLGKTAAAQGKRLLMEAALKLTASSRSISALGLRELGREAGLNPNTFYRHFANIDELGLAIIEEMSQQIRQPLRDLRKQAAESVMPSDQANISWEENPALNLQKATLANQTTVKLFFDYVEQNPNVFIIGVRELHGASPVLRKALRKVMADFAEDMGNDIRELNLLPMLDDETVQEVATAISREMFQLSMDYIEQPEQRDKILQQAESLVITLFTGATVLKGYGGLLLRAMGAQAPTS